MIKNLRTRIICLLMGLYLVLSLSVVFLATVAMSRQLQEETVGLLVSAMENPTKYHQIHNHSDQMHLPYFVLKVNDQGKIMGHWGQYYDLSDRELVYGLIRTAQENPGESGEITEAGLFYMKRDYPGYTLFAFGDITARKLIVRSEISQDLCLLLLGAIPYFGISSLMAWWTTRSIEQAWQKQKQFVADVSHELKSPMAVIMANAELVGSDGIGESERKKGAEYILSTGYRMRSLVESMLELTRMEYELPTVQFSRLDFSQLVTDAALSFQLLYEEKGIILETAVAEGIFLRGSSQHLYQLLDVLLDNGLKYSAPGGPVRVSLKKTGRSCLLCVSSPGEPLSGTDCEQIFRRFYRTDQTKHENGSYGLGLPIAAAVVNTHRGKIWAQSEAGRNTFCVRLPRSEQRRG